jgi:reactive intermediate/imine deaminase
MRQSIIHVALIVRDYDEAIAFFCGKLKFTLVEDTYQPEQDKRWVVVAPPGSRGTTLLLARASKAEQEPFIGRQSGGRVFLFLGTDDFWRDYNAMRDAGVTFIREPKDASYGTVAVFEDLYGNLWDLVQLSSEARAMSTTVETSTPLNTPTPIGPYNHIAKVGQSITIGGTAGFDPATGELAGADVYSQAKRILASFDVMLQSVGSDLGHVIHVNVFLKDMRDFGEMNRAYVDMMGAHRPARTVVGVNELPKPGVLLTMNLTAVTRDGSA